MSGSGVHSAARLAAYAALGLAGLWALMALLTWSGLQNGVRVSSPYVTHGYGQAALFSAPVHAIHVAGTLAWSALAALIGYAMVIRPLWGARGLASAPWLAFAGVVPGMLMLGALTRIVTLAAPNAIAAVIVLVLALAAAIYAIIDLRKRRRLPDQRPVWRWLAIAALALMASLIFQIHMDRGHAVAEGSIWFINEIFLSPIYGVGADGHFPLLTQHYDEAAFLHPLIYLTVSPGPDAAGALTLIYWMTLAVSRLGMIALTYIALRGLALDRFSAVICLAFVCLASLSLNPFSSRLLFDSLNPLLYALHMSRFLAPVLPLLIVSAAMQGAPRWDARTICVALLLGLGLAATPVHLAMIAPWGAAVLVLGALTRTPAEPVWRMAAGVAALVLALVGAAYFLQDAPAPVRAGMLAGASGIGGLLMVWSLLRNGWSIPRWGSPAAARLGVLVVLLAGFGLGNLVLGNVALLKLEPLLKSAWPWSGLDIAERLSTYIVSPQVALRPSAFCESGYEWGYRTVTGHCGSATMFARTYGLPFVLIAAVLAWRALRPELGDGIRAKLQDSVFVWSLVLCLLALPPAFLIFDFITPDGSDWSHSWSIWLRSRLAEPWMVGGALLALAFFLRSAGKRARRWTHAGLLAAAGIHALDPLVIPAQWVANVAYWTDAAMR